MSTSVANCCSNLYVSPTTNGLTFSDSEGFRTHRGHHHDYHCDSPYPKQITPPWVGILDIPRHRARYLVIIPTGNLTYPWFAAVYIGLVAATYCCLLINRFKFAEDGTPLSLWFLRISCLVVLGASFFVAIATFKQILGFSYSNPLALYIIYMVWPLICVPIYVIATHSCLPYWWPIGDIILGTAFFA